MERATVHVQGVVQSVGFRPFVYREAVERDLRGTVRNRGDAGVEIELEGAAAAIDGLLDRLRTDPPPLARVDSVSVDRWEPDGSAFETFRIIESDDEGSGGGSVPPDTAVCGACLAEMRDPDSRYHGYWATSCVDCGPRFTVIEALPYDRPTTSMAAFPMCGDCREEYESPTDRRYHAQTIACPQCGPSLRFHAVDDALPATGERPTAGRDPFLDDLRVVAEGRRSVQAAASALRDGDIVAIKGLGGAHLACDATDDVAVARLREHTGRPEKPFALMAPDLDAVESFARTTAEERDALTSARRPIVLLAATDEPSVSSAVAPGLHTIGTMLPYAGVHHLLFDAVPDPLVLTSANRPGQPMLVHNRALASELSGVADGFLLHDRRIVARCDDSVARFVAGERRLVRRSRGFAPTAVPVPDAGDAPVLGLGPELDVTAGLLADGNCYLTQHVGDVDDIETFEYLLAAVEHLRSVAGLDCPSVVAHDRHPGFTTTEHAAELEREGRVDSRVAVQHHHAHAASVLAEHGRDAAVAITVDGVGYGPDGTVWGGEVLDASRADYERVAGLAPVPMPGGDRATRYPARLVAGLLHRQDSAAAPARLARLGLEFPGGDEERDLVCQQLEAGVNTPTTTSAGRFLDAVSALIGVCRERTYEGEPAMKLEAVAARGTARSVDLDYRTTDGRRVLDTPALFDRLAGLVAAGDGPADVAATAQDALARGLAGLAVDAATDRGRETVALSGGVAYNDHIAARIRERVEAAGLALIGNERVPPGDGGIAYGQVAVAAARSA